MKYLIAFILLLAPLHALADDSPENPYKTLRQLPTPTVQTIEGEQQLCTTPEGWRNVMLLANDYQGLFMWRLEIQGVLSAHNDVILAYELKISSYEATIKILQAERSYKGTRIKELESALVKSSSGFQLEKGLMWGVILLESVALGALGVASFVQAN